MGDQRNAGHCQSSDIGLQIVTQYRCDGKLAGYTRGGGYGYILGVSTSLSMVEADQPIDPHWVATGKWEIEIAGVRCAAIASLDPMYDPKGERTKS